MHAAIVLYFFPDPYDFMRDLIAYILVLAVIVAVAYDGKVTLQK